MQLMSAYASTFAYGSLCLTLFLVGTFSILMCDYCLFLNARLLQTACMMIMPSHSSVSILLQSQSTMLMTSLCSL